jgi:hypothetical protein
MGNDDRKEHDDKKERASTRIKLQGLVWILLIHNRRYRQFLGNECGLRPQICDTVIISVALRMMIHIAS